MDFVKQVFHDCSNELVKNNKSLSIFAAATLTFIVWKVLKQTANKSSIDLSLLPPLAEGGIPLLGNFPQLAKDPIKFLNNAKDMYGPCFSLDIPGQGRLVVVTGHLIGEVMKNTRHFNFTKGIETIVPAAKVVELSYNHKHRCEPFSKRAKHPIVYPIKKNFQDNQIDVFSERIQLGLNRALDKHLKLEKGKSQTIDVWNTLTSVISHISCPCFAGSRVGNSQDLIDGMAVFTQKIIKAGLFLSLFPEWLGSFVVRCLFSVEYEMDLIMDHLTPELQRILNGEAGDEISFATMTLDLPKEDGSLRTVAEAAHLFNNVALASIHTTSHFTGFAFHELACRPALIQDLRKEIATLGEDRTPETVAKLPLMDSFFREVLRCDSDILGMHHLAMQDTILSTGQVIPKGSLVVGAIRQAHNDPRFAPIDEDSGLPVIGDTPLDEFDAYRYAKSGIKATAASLGHLTFGLGAHTCPGRYFASNEIKYVIAEMIMRYDVRTKSGKRAKDNILLGMTQFPPSEPLIFEAL